MTFIIRCVVDMHTYDNRILSRDRADHHRVHRRAAAHDSDTQCVGNLHNPRHVVCERSLVAFSSEHTPVRVRHSTNLPRHDARV